MNQPNTTTQPPTVSTTDRPARAFANYPNEYSSLLNYWERPVSQEAMAGLFADAYEGICKYSPGLGWYRWDSGWRPDQHRETFDLIRQFVAETVKGERSQETRAGSYTFAQGVERFAQADGRHAVAANRWDNDPDLIGVGTGYVHLPTGTWHLPGPAIRVTKNIGVTRVLGTYEVEPWHAPTWRRFLVEATGGDLDLCRFLKRWAGYCLTGHTREHAFLFVHGPGGTGKTTFLNTLRGLLADYAKHAHISTFLSTRGDRHPTDLAHLHGARLVTAVETDERRPWDEAKIKAVTAGDPVTARYMRKNLRLRENVGFGCAGARCGVMLRGFLGRRSCRSW